MGCCLVKIWNPHPRVGITIEELLPQSNIHTSDYTSCTDELPCPHEECMECIDCMDCTTVSLRDVAITKLPPDALQSNVTYIRVVHCTIRTVRDLLPPCLVHLVISYSCLEHFEPCGGLPLCLGYVDLSFNRLREIPHSVYNLYDSRASQGWSTGIILRNNNLWFADLSNIPLSMVNKDTIHELLRAHRLNLVSTNKLNSAISELNKRGHDYDSDAVEKQLSLRTQDGGYTWKNNENTHGHGVTQTTDAAVALILSIGGGSLGLTHLTPEATGREYATFLNSHEYEEAMTRHFQEDEQYHMLARCVLAIVLNHMFRDAIRDILHEEIKDGLCTCRAGRVSRMVNALNGFVEGVHVGLSKNEELSNTILVLRNRNASVYGNDTETYIAETVPLVWQALEDACVPEVEHKAWLEYI